MEFGFDWNAEKNRQLITERGVSFDIVVSRMRRGGHVDTIEHPNQDRYPGQFIYLVEIDNYIHLVPFIMQPDGTRFLKTIIPSRKVTRDYLRHRTT